MNGQGTLCKDKGPRVLLVEGRDDCHVVMALCSAHGVPQKFGIYACESDVKVLRRLNALVISPDMETIGVVLDADNDVETRWQSIKTKLGRHPYILPHAPRASGTIVVPPEGMPKLGFWLMPNNVDAGMLEDFCFELAEPRARSFAKNCVTQAQAEGVTRFREVHRSKAVIHTYLAWQDEPGRPLGQAITAQALVPNKETAVSFTDWLTNLFGDT